MNDLKKTKKQLIAELEALRKRTAEVEPGTTSVKPQDDKFKLLTEKAVVGIYIIQEAMLVYVNTSFARTFGYDPEEINGKLKPTDLIHPDDVPKTVQNLKKRMDGKLEKGKIEYKAVRKDGSIIWIELYSVLSEFQGRPAVMGTAIDITERKRAEDALQESEQKFRSITETATDYIFIKDRQGRYTFINKAMKDLLGLPENEILGKTPEKIFGAEEGGIIKEVDDRTFSGETVNETRNLLIGEHQRFFNTVQTPLTKADGKVTSIMGIVRDVTERKQTEEVLRDSEQRFRSLFEGLPQPIIVYDRDSTILMINQAGAENLGRSPNECLGKSLKELLPDIYDLAAERFRQVIDTGKQLLVEDRVELHTGAKWFWTILQPVCYGDGMAYAVMNISYDITERKRIEAQILTEKEFTDTALNAQLDTFFLFETATGKALRWNHAFREISGYTDEEIATMPAPTSYYSPVDVERAGVFIQKVLEEGTGTIELELICKDGQKVPTEYRVSIINDDLREPKYIISIGRDITERRKTEKALRESEQKFRTIADQSLMGISILQDNRIKYINQRMADLLEYSVEEYMSFNFIDFAKRSIHPDDFSFAMEQAQKKQSGEPDVVTQYEYRLITKSGKVKWVEQYSKTIEYLGKPADFVTLVDISNRKMAEEETKQYRHKLRELANQHILMEEQQKRKISNVLHDNLGQYLTAARLFLAPMIKEQADDEEKEKLNQIYQLIGKANDDAHSIIEEISPSALYEHEFATAIEWLAALYTKKYDMSITLHCDVQDVRLEFEKKVALFKAVQELLLNVLKHARTKEARVTIQRKDNFLITEVLDDGAGFSVSQEDSRQISGKGIGLFNISERIGSLGGELTIDSEPRRGTRIIIKLPEDT